MSRGFVKEDDQEQVPLVPPRADLPVNSINYVTPNGYKALLSEREKLLNEKESLVAINDNEHRIAINFIHAKLDLLNERTSTAKVIELHNQPPEEVRFGAWVTLEVNDDLNLQKYQIVGVDEANIKQRKISFISPIAQLLINKKVGEDAVLKLGAKNRIFKIIAIDYSLE